jgi:hypothetical protein
MGSRGYGVSLEDIGLKILCSLASHVHTQGEKLFGIFGGAANVVTTVCYPKP